MPKVFTCSALLTLSILREICRDRDGLDVDVLVAMTEGGRGKAENISIRSCQGRSHDVTLFTSSGEKASRSLLPLETRMKVIIAKSEVGPKNEDEK